MRLLNPAVSREDAEDGRQSIPANVPLDGVESTGQVSMSVPPAIPEETGVVDLMLFAGSLSASADGPSRQAP